MISIQEGLFSWLGGGGEGGGGGRERGRVGGVGEGRLVAGLGFAIISDATFESRGLCRLYTPSKSTH